MNKQFFFSHCIHSGCIYSPYSKNVNITSVIVIKCTLMRPIINASHLHYYSGNGSRYVQLDSSCVYEIILIYVPF